MKGELDAVVSQLMGTPQSGERVDVGGLPGVRYESDVPGRTGTRSIFIALFDEDVEYTLNCQWTAEKETEVREACDRALETLEKES